MKKLIKILLIITAIILFFIITLFVIREYRISKYNLTVEYKQAARECGLLTSLFPMDCCFESVVDMSKFGAKPMHDYCPSGYAFVQAGCWGSLPFCDPPQKPITSLDDCYNLKNKKNINQPFARSNIPGQEITDNDFNKESENIDSCIFDFIDKHEEKASDDVCNKILSNYYKFLCRQRFAFSKNDPKLCTIEYLGKQSNVDGCFNVLAKKINDKSLCEKSSNPAICMQLFEK